MLFGSVLVTASANGPVIPKGKGSACVAETDFMRRNHMDLIIHQRDETVIRGIRDEPFSLVECVECHSRTDDNNQHVRIDAEGEFCAACHSFTAVKIDCFDCHRATPDDPSETVGSLKPIESTLGSPLGVTHGSPPESQLTQHIKLALENYSDKPSADSFGRMLQSSTVVPGTEIEKSQDSGD